MRAAKSPPVPARRSSSPLSPRPPLASRRTHPSARDGPEIRKSAHPRRPDEGRTYRHDLDALSFRPDLRRRPQRRSSKALVACLGPPLLRHDQPRASSCPPDPDAAIPVKRTKVVRLTAMAPTTEKIICQVADGIASWAIPWVAL